MSPGAPRPATSLVRMSFMVVVPSLARGAGVGQQRHLAAVLHRGGDVALVLGAVAGDPTGPDLAAVGNVLPQQVGVLVVDVGNLLLRLAKGNLRHRVTPSRARVARCPGNQSYVWGRDRAVARGTAPAGACWPPATGVLERRLVGVPASRGRR